MDVVPSTPKPKRQQLTRDTRRDILLMRSLHRTYAEIAEHLKISESAVEYTCQQHKATPIKRRGRPSTLSSERVDEIEVYLRTSKQTRRLPYTELGRIFEVHADTIKRALRKRGYARRVALRMPPITERVRLQRLHWAREHLDWTEDQWMNVLWTDESWVQPGHHRKIYVTRKAGEELDPTCIRERIPKKKGWMFWGSFSGTTKGPTLFWEKEWGSINAESYSQRIVPLIHGWLTLHPELQLMQDNAPGHAADQTLLELEERGIIPIKFPPFSPDLNPIEEV